MPTLVLRPVLFASILLATGVARAQLATVSPFLPPSGSRGAAAPTADAPLEFRGVVELPDGPAFRVVDPARKTGAWVRLNERDPDLGVLVKQADAAHDTVTVEHQGRTFTLALHQSKIASAGPAMVTAMAASPLTRVPVMTTTAQPLSVPLQQAQIDAVAAAVAQRRALRDQAAQQINQGVRLVPQVIQPQPQRAPGQNSAGAPGTPNSQRGQRRNRQP